MVHELKMPKVNYPALNLSILCIIEQSKEWI